MAVLPRKENPPLSRFVLPIAGLIGLGLCIGGIVVLFDPLGSSKLLAMLYDALGNGTGAAALRNGQGDQLLAKILLAVIALGVGVGGIWLLFIGVGWLVSQLRPQWRDRILPWVFVGPALALLSMYLLYPAVATVFRSFFDAKGAFTLDNYTTLLTPEFVSILSNNLIWLIVATSGAVFLGLVIAGLFDRVRREALAKTFIFL